MLAAGLITFREGLEAALIVGIVLGYLKKIGRLDRQGYLWVGVVAAALVSLGVALGLQAIGAQFTGRAEEIFEGATMFLAVGVLTWMIFWMRYQGRYIKVALERDVEVAVTSGQNWALFGLAFIAVFREGVETALFLSAAAYASAATDTFWGGLLGLGVALLVGYLIFATTVRLDVRRFFDVTSVLLLLFRRRASGPWGTRVPGGRADTGHSGASLGHEQHPQRELHTGLHPEGYTRLQRQPLTSGGVELPGVLGRGSESSELVDKEGCGSSDGGRSQGPLRGESDLSASTLRGSR